MSFRVTCTYEIQDGWEDVDRRIYEAVGRKSDSNGSSPCIDKRDPNKTIHIRDHVWFCEKCDQAAELRLRLIQLGLGILASFREV